MMELSFSGPFVHWNIRSLDRSFPGTFIPGTLDLSCRGPFIHLTAQQYLTGTCDDTTVHRRHIPTRADDQ